MRTLTILLAAALLSGCKPADDGMIARVLYLPAGSRVIIMAPDGAFIYNPVTGGTAPHAMGYANVPAKITLEADPDAKADKNQPAGHRLEDLAPPPPLGEPASRPAVPI